MHCLADGHLKKLSHCKFVEQKVFDGLFEVERFFFIKCTISNIIVVTNLKLHFVLEVAGSLPGGLNHSQIDLGEAHLERSSFFDSNSLLPRRSYHIREVFIGSKNVFVVEGKSEVCTLLILSDHVKVANLVFPYNFGRLLLKLTRISFDLVVSHAQFAFGARWSFD